METKQKIKMHLTLTAEQYHTILYSLISAEKDSPVAIHKEGLQSVIQHMTSNFTTSC